MSNRRIIGALNSTARLLTPFGDWQGSKRCFETRTLWTKPEEVSSLPSSRSVQLQEFSTRLTLKCHDTIGTIWKNQHSLLVRMNKVSKTETNWLLQRGEEVLK